jgi:hypothetical protein
LTSRGYLYEKTVHRDDIQEEFGDAKWVTRIRKSMKDRQNNGHTQRNTNDVNMTRALLQTTVKIETYITTRNSECKDIY